MEDATLRTPQPHADRRGRLTPGLLAALALLTPATPAHPQEPPQEPPAPQRVGPLKCGFTLEPPALEGLRVRVDDASVTVRTWGLRLEATCTDEPFADAVARLSNARLQAVGLGAMKFEPQDDEPRRGQWRGVNVTSHAGTGIWRNKRQWVSWLVFDGPGQQRTILTYQIDNNPSDEALLSLYDALTTSLRWNTPTGDTP